MRKSRGRGETKEEGAEGTKNDEGRKREVEGG